MNTSRPTMPVAFQFESKVHIKEKTNNLYSADYVQNAWVQTNEIDVRQSSDYPIEN